MRTIPNNPFVSPSVIHDPVQLGIKDVIPKYTKMRSGVPTKKETLKPKNNLSGKHLFSNSDFLLVWYLLPSLYPVLFESTKSVNELT